MATLAEALAAAVKFHQTGNLAEAERIYRDILKVQPNHADAWHLLGLVALSAGGAPKALEYIGRAVQLDGRQASFHNHLGEAYRALGRLAEAETCCRQAVALKPDWALAHNTLGAMLREQGQLEPAIGSFRRALELQPDFVQALWNLGAAWQAQGHLDDAIGCYRRAIQAKPDYAIAYNNLGTALAAQGQVAPAAEAYRQAIKHDPRFAQAYCNLGNLFHDQGRIADAVASYQRALEHANLAEAHFNLGVILQSQGQATAADCYRRAIAIQPEYAEAYSNLGTLHRAQYQFAEAIDCYQRALEIRPDFAETLSNLGNVFKLQNRLAEARICYDQSLRINPHSALSRYNRSLIDLAVGDFARAWPDYEARWDCPDFPQRRLSQPLWTGDPLGDRVLLVHAEQGIGDTLQFARYLNLLGQEHEVFFELPRLLVPLFEQSGFRNLVVRDTTLPKFDMQAPLLSLPGILGTTLETIPADVPYLSADPARVAFWRDQLAGREGFKIGIAWQGRTTYRDDSLRSIRLAHFAPLATAGVELISLQQGVGTEQLAEVRERFHVTELGDNFDREHGAFIDSAALMKNLDLVITSDTAIAHLAGALGVPVWVALPQVPDWRWLFDRSDSPWYPTMRLFRQTTFNDWPPVFAQMAAELRRLIASR